MNKHCSLPFTACAAGIIVASLSISCAPGGDEPSVLVASVRQADAWVRNFNPLSARGDLLWPSRGGVYEPLMVFNVMTSDYEPWLATGYAWDDTDQILTFELRPEVRWSDGSQFDSEDVVFTFELLRRYPALDHNNVWSFLREVRTEGDLDVAFVFEHTMVPALEHLARQPIVPEHVWSSIDDPVAFLNPDPVATGPFTGVVHFSSSVYELARNPAYWRGVENPVDILRVPAYPDNATAISAILAGDVDWSGNFVPDAQQTFIAADTEHRISWSPLIDGPIFLLTNTTEAPFDDVRVRKAFSLAIDRERLARDAMMGTTRPVDATFLDDAKKRFRNDDAVALDDWTTYDPDRAEALLDEAGFARGAENLRGPRGAAPWSFEVLVPAGWSDWVSITEILAENLAAVGVAVRPGLVTYDQWLDRGQTGEFDLALGMTETRLTTYAIYRSMIGSATVRPLGEHSLTNWQRFSDEDADSLLLAYEMTSDAEIQDEILRRVQLRIVETAPAIPLVLGPSWGVANSARIVGFPSEADPYARLSPNSEPDCLLVLTRLRARR